MGTPMCTAQHCGSVSQQINDTCKANGWPVNHLVLVCDKSGYCCNCTCSCLAYGTPVAIPGGTKAIETFALGDPVLAAGPDLKWVSMPVEFSDGTSPSSVQPQMVYITYGSPAQTVTVTLDHTFLAPGGKLIRANRLQVGDSLITAQGDQAAITKIEIKQYVGGVWNIATTHEEPKSLDGHLINTQGIVSGDYAVQLFFDELTKAGYTTGSAQPSIGTEPHRAKAALVPRQQIPAKPLAQVLSANLASHWPQKGVHIHLDHDFVIEVDPKNPTAKAQSAAQGFLTATQAAEVRDRVIGRTFEEAARVVEFTRWLFTLFHGFYPDINFILDWPNANANAYALMLDEQKNVLIQGGLLRAQPMDWQSTALIMAYSVNRFAEATPKGSDGLLCKPQCDYRVIATMQNVYYPLYPNVIFDSIGQITALFNEIPTKTDDAIRGCHATDLDCRVLTYNNALQMLPLPACAGGPVQGKKK